MNALHMAFIKNWSPKTGKMKMNSGSNTYDSKTKEENKSISL